MGAGTLTFYWKVSSKKNSDWLEFYIDDVRQDRISGNVNWQQQLHTVTGAESHTLKWRYVKDGSGSGGSDCGWVDYVQWSGASSGPAWRTITYTYDPSGRRIAKALDGETAVKYVYDGGQCIAEYDANDVLLRKFIYGPGIDQPICMIDVADSNAVYYYHFDGLGSVVALSDSAGDTVQTYEYSVYGQVAASDPNHPNPFLFTARRFDAETGLYDYRARCYNPYIGRFLQTDPIGYANGINWYAYCGNNPVLFIDPWGLCDDYYVPTAGEWAGAVLGGIGEGLYNRFVDPFVAIGDYYGAFREADIGPWVAALQAANMGLGRAVGYATIAEGLTGYDLRSGQELSTGESTKRVVLGTGQVVLTVGGAHLAGKAPRSARRGRLGNQATRRHVRKVAGELEKRGWEITHGGGIGPEEYLRGPSGRAGSNFVDITAVKNGRTLRINTIDTLANGVTPTAREAAAAAAIRTKTPGEHLLLVPKPGR